MLRCRLEVATRTSAEEESPTLHPPLIPEKQNKWQLQITADQLSGISAVWRTLLRTVRPDTVKQA